MYSHKTYHFAVVVNIIHGTVSESVVQLENAVRKQHNISSSGMIFVIRKEKVNCIKKSSPSALEYK